ncbi:MAG: YeeE/YedE family protein [Bdellovibrionales bacterium]|nr:YeeE/YedE family protein [Bdellovibrionales bacterium]
MMNFFKREKWSPYLVGALIGVLSWITFGGMTKALGTSTTFVKAVGAAEAVVAPQHVQGTEYFAKYLDGQPAFDWQFALVLAMILGAYVAAKLGGGAKQDAVPSVWSESFGSSKAKRYVGAFLGGVLVLFGARLAGGCTSGHGISGGLQLAISSWVFLGALFAAGIPTALMLYRKRN